MLKFVEESAGHPVYWSMVSKRDAKPILFQKQSILFQEVAMAKLKLKDNLLIIL